MRIAAYTPDLMDRSKISAAATAAGHDLTYAGSADALVGLAGVDLIVVDLSKKGVPEAMPAIVASGTRVIAFASHVDIPKLDAGVDVLPRSTFFGSLNELLRA